MRKLIVAAGFLFVGTYVAFGQCATSGTITSDCTTAGDLTVNGTTLTVSPGVVITITGTLTIQGGGTLSAAGATINANTFADGWGSPNTIDGGTYNITTTFNSGSGGDFTIDGATIIAGGSSQLSGNDIIITNSSLTAASIGMNLSTMTISNSAITTTGTGSMQLEEATVTNSTIEVGGALNINSGSSSISNSDIDVGVGFVATTGTNALTMNGGGTLTLRSGSTMDVKGDLVNNELYIDNSDVVITGDFDNAGAEVLVVENGGTIRVGGDFNNSGSGNTTADGGGIIIIDGNYDNTGGGSTTIQDGGFSVGGTYTGTTPTGADISGDCSSGGGGCCGSACDTLPVSFESMEAEPSLESVLISWTTSSELNNDYFNLYRSSNGKDYKVIKRVIGKGTTNEVSHYEVVDYPPIAGIYYYQIEQVDFDGKTEFFPKKRVSFRLDGSQEISLYPMPVLKGRDFYLDYSESNELILAQIFDLSGSVKHQMNVEMGQNYITFKSSELDLGSGVYVIRIQIGTTVLNKKIKME